MNPGFKLYRLQQVDSQLDKANNRLAEIKSLLADDAELKAATQDQEIKNQSLEKAQKALRTAEHNTQAQRDKIKNTERRLYGGSVTNPKELQDLQQESAALKRFLVTLEDRQLEAMIASEEAEVAFNQAQQNVEAITARKVEENAALLGEQNSLTAEVARLEEERQAAIMAIEESDLAIYGKLRESRQGVAVALVADKACSACGSTLNAAHLQEARSATQLTRCSFCGRILYAT